MAKPAIFISSSMEGLPVARELGRQLEKIASVTVWAESTFNPGQTVFESLSEVVDRSDFAVFVLSPDATSTSRESRWTPRPNVLFELGFLAGREGHGPHNFARMNMPIEMGMALFHALYTQHREHRCLFFVPTPHDYKAFASDLSGLDPRVHNNEDTRILTDMYEWLRDVVPGALFNSQPTVTVLDKFMQFKARKELVKGCGNGGRPSHDETREVMYQICSECGWWDWRENRMRKDEFPNTPLALKG